MSIKVINIRRGLIWDKVRFRASRYHEVTFGTLMGDKTFFMNEGDEITLRQSKDVMWEISEQANGLKSLVTQGNQTKFGWFWA